jgi:DDE superfamily endonuclease
VGGLIPAELAAVGGRLEAFADDIFESLPRTDQRARGQCYLRGLMLEGRRKSIEPMAQRLGEVHYQALHHFVAASPWDWRPVRRRLAERLHGALEPVAWVVDDTGFPKDGTHSVGVQRQYSGTLGKRANCQLGVSVNAITEHASCPLDWRLFLPEGWDNDHQRRVACHVPEQVHHRPKWQLVLDMLDELAGWELLPPVLVADCGYGEVGEFRAGLDLRQIPYVVEVRADTSAYTEQVRPTVHRTRAGAGGQGRATTSGRARLRNLPCVPGSRPAPTLSGGAGAGACNAAASWRCGSARRASRHAGWPRAPSCRCAGCWSSGLRARPRRSSTGCRTCPRPRRWWSWCGWPGCAGEWSRTTASAKAPLGWIISRGVAGWAGTTTSRWSRSRTVSSPWSGCATQTGGVGLSLWQLLEQLQVLLACWAGACPVCQRPAPRWLRRTGRPRAPT